MDSEVRPKKLNSLNKYMNITSLKVQSVRFSSRVHLLSFFHKFYSHRSFSFILERKLWRNISPF